MSFGEKLASLRKEKGISQEELASELNVSRQAVSKWESNNAYPETDKIIAICKIFNYSMDELIGLKEGHEKRKEENLFSKYYNNFIKGIKMFSLMTFKQKIKCLLELLFYSICLFVFLIVLSEILRIIFTESFSFIPREIINHLIDFLGGCWSLICLALAIYTIAKIYKIRYLDYYEEVNPEVIVNNNIKEDSNKSKINIREEKIIIRDANQDFNPFRWFKKVFKFLGKIIVSFMAIPICIAFIFFIMALIFTLYYIGNGLIILYIALGIISAILFAYLLIELSFKFVFGMPIKAQKYLIIFLSSIILCGISGGLFLGEISQYEITPVTTLKDLDNEIIVPMSDNVAIHYLRNADIIFENRSDILSEFYVFDKNLVNIIPSSYNTLGFFENGLKYIIYDYNYYYEGLSMKSFINLLLKSTQDKKLYYYKEDVHIVVHISKENYEKILKNNQELGL